MEHLYSAPQGATEREAPRIGKGILKDSQPSNGWRKQSQALLITEKLAEEGERQTVSKARSIVAVKKVGAHIGLKAADLLLLDTLCAFTQPQDWEEDKRPIVWPSNTLLMQHTGFSLSALKRHIRRLAEACIIAFNDSSNGKRWGHRDGNGYIVEAYGFDLSPLAARAEEFECVYEQLKAERMLCQQLKRQITVVRRTIRARLEAPCSISPKLLEELRAKYRDLVHLLPNHNSDSNQITIKLNGFNDLSELVDEVLLGSQTDNDIQGNSTLRKQSLSDTGNSDPRETNNEPHIQTTNELKSINSSENTKPDLKNRCETNKRLDLATIIQACPEFQTWAHDLGGYLKHWPDLQRTTATICPMIGISEKLRHLAHEQMGQRSATAAVVLVFEKFCTGELFSPAGYLRGMMKKASDGTLNLERSFVGRLHREIS
ncbi:plasmid replication protein RepC [uncultured Roseobacter sp.]|uniref:plasmid replication protein RepC n=1 Tax=uncultured Roseobacter sp. TaxID=114847 RepID=UPI00260C565A|nr:plasmid replication protein RepC [uncultured Roseobacter sp.]